MRRCDDAQRTGTREGNFGRGLGGGTLGKKGGLRDVFREGEGRSVNCCSERMRALPRWDDWKETFSRKRRKTALRTRGEKEGGEAADFKGRVS